MDGFEAPFNDCLQVAAALIGLLAPETPTGTVLLIRQDGTLQQPYAKRDTAGIDERVGVMGLKTALSSPATNEAQGLRRREAMLSWVTKNWPTSFRKVRGAAIGCAVDKWFFLIMPNRHFLCYI